MFHRTDLRHYIAVAIIVFTIAGLVSYVTYPIESSYEDFSVPD